MAAVFVPASRAGLPHHLVLPPADDAAGGGLQEVGHGLGVDPPPGTVVLEAGDWSLTLPELRTLQERLQRQGLSLRRVACRCGETLVAAAALGLEATPPAIEDRTGSGIHGRPDGGSEDGPHAAEQEPGLTIHRGTLRSGDHLQVEGSVLLLGDVNPGARVSAGRHVLVWGRLRGIAHAGCRGDDDARIVALQLRPLQLRIAGVVARGPEDLPPAGLSEEARLVAGEIRIDPATPCWPLPG